MSLAILLHFLRAQHVSDINISIIRILRLFYWITTLVVLFLVRCVLEFRYGCVGVVSVLQASASNTDTTPTQPHRNSNTHRTKNNMTNVVIQQSSRKILMKDILTLILLTWRIWWAPNNTSRWQMGFNSAFKGLMSEKSFSLQHGYHSNPTTPKHQHTSNQEQYDQRGNSTE